MKQDGLMILLSVFTYAQYKKKYDGSWLAELFNFLGVF